MMENNSASLPQGWEVVSLSKVVKINSGIALPSIFKDKEHFHGGEIPFYKVSQMNNHHSLMTTAELYFSEVIAQKEKIKIFPKGSILIPKRGGAILTNKKRMMTVDASYDSNIMGLKAINKVLSDEFLFAFLESIDLANFVDTTTIPQINNKHIDMMDIPLPALEEQRRIVGVLDGLFGKIDKSIALLDESIASASSLMPSALNEVFEELGETWRFVKVENLCTKITDGTHATPKYIDIGIPFLSVKDITNGKISFENTRYISQEEHEFLSRRCHVEKNDILYTKVGTTGVAKVVDVDIDFSIFVSIALLKPTHSQIQSKFFEFMLNSPNCYEQAQSRTRGVANRNLVLKDIKEIFLPLPPLDIQTQTVAYLDALHVKAQALKKAQEKKKEALLALKASLLESAFKGAL